MKGMVKRCLIANTVTDCHALSHSKACSQASMTSSEPYHTSLERSAKVPFLLMLWKTPSSSKLSAPCRQQAHFTTFCPRPYNVDSSRLANYSTFHCRQPFTNPTVQVYHCTHIYQITWQRYKITWQLYEAMKFTSRCAQHLGTTPSPS